MRGRRRPWVINHPLNYARRIVFITTVGLEHGALAIVGQHLGFLRVIVNVSDGAKTLVQCLGKNIETLNGAASAVVTPILIDGPKAVDRKHPSQRFDRWHRRSGTRFGIETKC